DGDAERAVLPFEGKHLLPEYGSWRNEFQNIIGDFGVLDGDDVHPHGIAKQFKHIGFGGIAELDDGDVKPAAGKGRRPRFSQLLVGQKLVFEKEVIYPHWGSTKK